MSLIENRIVDGEIVEYSKVDVAIQRLKSFEPPDGYWLAFSGGKDSVVIKALADMAGVKYEAHFSLTTVDPPELVAFVKTFPDVIIDKPKESMWKLIVKKGPPTQLQRFCCQALKEGSGMGRVVISGVRWAESAKRKNNRNLVDIGGKGGIVLNDDNDESRRIVENCFRTKKTLVNPIIDWTDENVWEFIWGFHIRYCGLYDEGWKRIGCIGCPMSNDARFRDFERWPTYKTAYVHAFDKMVDRRRLRGLTMHWQTGQECFDWWMNIHHYKNNPIEGQLDMEVPHD